LRPRSFSAAGIYINPEMLQCLHGMTLHLLLSKMPWILHVTHHLIAFFFFRIWHKEKRCKDVNNTGPEALPVSVF